MYISLNALKTLCVIALLIAITVCVIYLCVLIVRAMETLKLVNKTLDQLQEPLKTVDQVSQALNEVNGAAKKAALGAIDIANDGINSMKDWIDKKKNPAGSQPSVASAAADQPALTPEFRKVEAVAPAQETEPTEHE